MIDHTKVTKEVIDRCSEEQLFKLKKQLEEKTEYLRMTSSQSDDYQYVAKILLNSIYGAQSTPYFPLFDLDNAEAITMTGQVIITESGNYVNEYTKTNYETFYKGNVICGGDTDSNSVNTNIRFSNVKIKINGNSYDYNTKFLVNRAGNIKVLLANELLIGDDILENI